MPGDPLRCARCLTIAPDVAARKIPFPLGKAVAPLCGLCEDLYLAWVAKEHPEWLESET